VYVKWSSAGSESSWVEGAAASYERVDEADTESVERLPEPVRYSFKCFVDGTGQLGKTSFTMLG
jgi:hypothetical protein